MIGDSNQQMMLKSISHDSVSQLESYKQPGKI